jgi:hypothetical protein
MNYDSNRSMVSIALLLALGTAAPAQIVSVGGRLRHGEGRPPLYLNLSPSTTTSSAAPYTPAQVRHAYGFDKLSADGAGKTIAIVDAYGSRSLQNDFNKFCSTFGLPAQTIQVVYAQGKPAPTAVGRKKLHWMFNGRMPLPPAPRSCWSWLKTPASTICSVRWIKRYRWAPRWFR